jgi:monovalent cation/proton antiporter MnhG/PhaG subunit
VIEIIVIALAAVGWAFSLSGAVGILRMPDVYCRIQCSSKMITMGALPVLIALVVGEGPVSVFGSRALLVAWLYEPADRSLCWARAGHLPPILVRDGQAEQLPLPEGLLLGADPDARYAEEVTRLRLGDTLLLFTDGLIERRDEPIDEALTTLLRVAGRLWATSGATPTTCWPRPRPTPVTTRA